MIVVSLQPNVELMSIPAKVRSLRKMACPVRFFAIIFALVLVSLCHTAVFDADNNDHLYKPVFLDSSEENRADDTASVVIVINRHTERS